MSPGSASEKKKLVTLRSADRQECEVEEAVAAMSETIGHIMEDNCVDGVIPVPNVTGNILAMVIDYCKKHVEMDIQVQEAATAEIKEGLKKEFKNWEAKFIDVGQNILYDLLIAANYLCIKSLLDLGAQTVAGMIRGKSTEEIRQTFGIQNDFTPEEEENIKKDNDWAFKIYK